MIKSSVLTDSTQDRESVNQALLNEWNSAANLQSAFKDGTALDMDTALAILPLSRGAAKAVYWVYVSLESRPLPWQ